MSGTFIIWSTRGTSTWVFSVKSFQWKIKQKLTASVLSLLSVIKRILVRKVVRDYYQKGVEMHSSIRNKAVTLSFVGWSTIVYFQDPVYFWTQSTPIQVGIFKCCSLTVFMCWPYKRLDLPRSLSYPFQGQS